MKVVMITIEWRCKSGTKTSCLVLLQRMTSYSSSFLLKMLLEVHGVVGVVEVTGNEFLVFFVHTIGEDAWVDLLEVIGSVEKSVDLSQLALRIVGVALCLGM
jgi:hypothetical protein